MVYYNLGFETKIINNFTKQINFREKNNLIYLPVNIFMRLIYFFFEIFKLVMQHFKLYIVFLNVRIIN